MTQKISRRHFLNTVAAFSATLATTPVYAAAPEKSLRPVGRGEDFLKRIQQPAEALIERARLGGQVGFSVADVQSGEMLEDHMPDTLLPPASVAKALTAAFALDVLGPGYQFATRVVATGGIAEGVVKGDLILIGSGDPTLDTDRLAELAAAIAAAGVTKVEGRFLVWQAALPFVPRIDNGQPDQVGYSPAVSGLNLNYNRVHFEWRRSGADYQVTMEGRTEIHRPAVRFARMSIIPRKSPIYTYEDKSGRDNWTVARDALGKGGARWLPVRKPALYAGEVFQVLAKAQGLTLAAPVVAETLPEGDEIARTESGPLRVMLRDMLKWSTNLTAEVVGMTATVAKTGAMPTDLAASASVMNDWAKEKFGLQSIRFVDHSGLGGESRITSTDMMDALRQLRQSSGLKTLLKPFRMLDENRKVIKDHPLSVHAKTGTLNFVSGLAGYVDLPDGRELVFAIFAANMDRRAALSKAERERPEGGASWNRRAKGLQQSLIERWGILYTS